MQSKIPVEKAVPVPRAVTTVEPDVQLPEALRLMRRHHIHHLVVVADGKVTGILSDRDILARGLTEGDVVLNPILRVGEVMRKVAQPLEEQSDLRTAVSRMRDCGVSALPIISNGQLTGIVTESDLLRVLGALLNEAKASDKGQLILANPVVQRIMSMLSDAGI